MGKSLTLVLGGARSGKSTYALRLAEKAQGQVLFVATAVAFDDEMAYRIAVHRTERSPDWKTLEALREVGKAIRNQPDPGLVLLDCLTLLANNVLLALPDPDDAKAAQTALDVEIKDLLAAYEASIRIGSSFQTRSGSGWYLNIPRPGLSRYFGPCQSMPGPGCRPGGVYGRRLAHEG